MTKDELTRIKKAFLEAIQLKASSQFDYLVTEGWLVITDKKPIKISGVEIVNYKNGAEFGKIFARLVEMNMGEFFKDID